MNSQNNNLIQKFNCNRKIKFKVAILSFLGSSSFVLIGVVFGILSFFYILKKFDEQAQLMNQPISAGVFFLLFYLVFTFSQFFGVIVWQFFNKKADRIKERCSTLGKYKLATMNRRFWAYYFDLILQWIPLILVMMIFAVDYEYYQSVSNEELEMMKWLHFFVGLILYLIVGFFHAICEAIWGKSIGKKLFKIKIVNAQAQKPGFFRILARSIFKILDLISYYLMSYTAIQRSSQNQSVGDALCQTYVIQDIKKKRLFMPELSEDQI